MSKYMLTDDNAINKVNPFVQRDFSLPGAIGETRKFKEYTPTDETETEANLFNDNTFICKYGITSGDKVVDTCRPSSQKCPLSRPLIPGRNIDLGEGNVGENKVVYNNYVELAPYKMIKWKKIKDHDTYLLVIIILILLLSYLKQ